MTTAEYEKYLERLAGYHAQTKHNWADSLPEEYRGYLWLLMERDGYFSFKDDALEVAAACGCRVRQYHPPMGKSVPFVFFRHGEEFEQALDLLDDNPRGLFLCKYEGQGNGSQATFVYLPVKPLVAQTSLFD